MGGLCFEGVCQRVVICLFDHHVDVWKTNRFGVHHRSRISGDREYGKTHFFSHAVLDLD